MMNNLKQTKNILKVISKVIFYILVAFIILLPKIGLAQTVTIEPQNLEIDKNTDFDVILKIDSASNLTSIYTDLDFDPAFLEYVGADDGGFFSQNGCFAPLTAALAEDNPGKLIFGQTQFGCDPVSGSGDIAVFHFKSLDKAGTDSISFSNYGLINVDWETITGEGWNPVLVTVKGAEPPGDTEPPSISITNPSSEGTYNYINLNNVISLSGTVSDNVGVFSISWSSDQGLSGTASGTNAWTADIPLSLGDNLITVTAFDAAENSSPTQIIINYNLPSELPVISDIQVIAVATSATITWKTDEPSDSQVYYGLTEQYDRQTPLDSNLLTDHIIILEDLIEETIYHFKILSKDEKNNLAISADQTFKTATQTVTSVVAAEPQTLEVNKNTTFSIALNVASPENISSVSSDIDFDPEMLEYIGATEGVFLSQGATTFLLAPLVSPGKVGFGITQLGGSGISGSGQVVTFQFRSLLQAGTTTISFTNAWLGVQKGDNLNFITGEGWDPISITINDLLGDNIPPSINITGPSTTGSYAYSNLNETISISGEAFDNISISSVAWVSDRGSAGTAVGTSTWSASVPLAVGANTITATASDAAGNSSSTQIVINYTNPGSSEFLSYVSNESGGSSESVMPLIIYEEDIKEVGTLQNTTTIKWITNYKSTSRVIFSRADQPHNLDPTNAPLFGYASSTSELDSPASINGVFFHGVTINGLLASTTYFFRCVSAASPPTFSQEHFFTTTGEVIPAETLLPQVISTTTQAESQVVQNAPIQSVIPPEPIKNLTTSTETRTQNLSAGAQSQNAAKDSFSGNLSADIGSAAASQWFRNKWFWIIAIAIIVILASYYIIQRKLKKQ